MQVPGGAEGPDIVSRLAPMKVSGLEAADHVPAVEMMTARRRPMSASRGKLARMFIIELLYKAELAQIDAHMTDHMAFLNKHYAAGRFVVSGRKVPRDGGIIVATGGSRAEIEAIIADDPFVARGLADFRVIEFRASQRAPDVPKRLA